MSAETTIRIQVGLPEHQRDAAAKLYYEAFRQKLHPIFRDESLGMHVLRQSLNSLYAIVALQDEVLVGIAGFKDSLGSLVDIQPKRMTQAFGWFGGWGRLLALSLFSRPAESSTLLMDGIVVDPKTRGLGIGSKLLDAVVDLAESRNYQQVRLDVVDTNPRAKQLYERKGFIPLKTNSYPLLTRFFGFSSSTTMLKRVDSYTT